jgi:hypothetical protein
VAIGEQLHAVAAKASGRVRAQVHIKQDPERVTEPPWVLWRRKHLLSFPEIEPQFLFIQPVT